MSVVTVVYYAPGTGQISSVMTVQEEMIEANCPDGLSWFIPTGWPRPDENYIIVGIDGPEVFTRPDMPITHSALTMTTAEDLLIESIPIGAQFRHPDGTETIDDGSVSWGSDVPGEFYLFIDRFPYKSVRLHVKVNPV